MDALLKEAALILKGWYDEHHNTRNVDLELVISDTETFLEKIEKISSQSDEKTL